MRPKAPRASVLAAPTGGRFGVLQQRTLHVHGRQAGETLGQGRVCSCNRSRDCIGFLRAGGDDAPGVQAQHVEGQVQD